MSAKVFEVDDNIEGYPPILIIDDDPWVQKILTSHFKSWGFKTLSAAHPTDGMAMAVNFKPSMIILDVILPDIKGILLLKMLKKIDITADVPVIILSGDFDKQVIEEAMRLGVNSIMSKPFSEKVLVEKLQACLGYAVLYKMNIDKNNISSIPIVKM
ncbi:MAG: response regulator receiver protein [Ignavibacteria bacterium]|nr:response regulator receiver protein [Ignavibacteria bacterium]